MGPSCFGNNIMCQKCHKSFQRTTGQTPFFFVEINGLGVTSYLIAP